MGGRAAWGLGKKMVRRTFGVPRDAAPRFGRRAWRWVAALLSAVGVLALLATWWYDELEAVEFAPASARERLEQRTLEQRTSEERTSTSPPWSEVLQPVPGETRPDAAPTRSPVDADGADEALPRLDVEELRSFLVIGSDARAGLAGSRADVILVGLLPEDGSDPQLFSLPRDLWLPDPCRGGHQRINAAFNGCGELANGHELMAIVVEDFTGIPIDHVVTFDFEGFREVIDAVGGVRICVDHPVRDVHGLSLPEGCTLAGGDQALAWVRSRRTQEFVDGRWRTMPGVNDLSRNQRQQDLVEQVARRVESFGTLGNLSAFASSMRDNVALGDNLSLLDGARLAWSMRGRVDDVRRFSIPVVDMTTSAGAQVLLPTEPFATTFVDEVGVELEVAD